MRRAGDARPEVIDVWFDSGAMPFAQHHFPFEHRRKFAESYPADFICEAQDQTRGWFYSLLAVATLTGAGSVRERGVPGLIVDEDGQKMSKSKGNTVEPWQVLDRYGADAFRWYFFTAKQPWDGYRFSTEAIGEGVRLFLKQLWSTYYFYVLYANACAVSCERAMRARLPAPRAGGERGARARGPGPLGALAHGEHGGAGGGAPGVLRRDGRGTGDRGAGGRAVELVRAPLAQALLGRRRGGVRDAALVPGGGVEAAGAAVPVHGGRAVRQPRRDARERAPVRLPAAADVGERDDELEQAMALARETVRLGLAARGQAKIKVRQPLGEAVVVADGREREAIERLAEVVREELNVRGVRFVAAADELGRYEVKPNYRALGPLFGKDMPLAAAAIAALDPAHVAAALRDGGQLGIAVDGREHTLRPEDLLLTLRAPEGFSVEREGAHAVALDLSIDAELRREGHAREIVHAVQNARKSAGLRVEDRIELALDGDPALLDAAGAHREHIAVETLTVAFELESGTTAELGASGYSEQTTIDGLPLHIALRRG